MWTDYLFRGFLQSQCFRPEPDIFRLRQSKEELEGAREKGEGSFFPLSVHVLRAFHVGYEVICWKFDKLHSGWFK